MQLGSVDAQGGKESQNFDKEVAMQLLSLQYVEFVELCTFVTFDRILLSKVASESRFKTGSLFAST